MLETDGGVEYQEVDGRGQPTGASITKDADGSVVISDGQGNTLTRNSDGSGSEEMTMQSLEQETQTVRVNFDKNGNVTSWTDADGTHKGNTADFNFALQAAGLQADSQTLPDLSDPVAVSQFVDNVSQQVDNQQNNQPDNQNPTDPGGPVDTSNPADTNE